jgi:hypothetical protein
MATPAPAKFKTKAHTKKRDNLIVPASSLLSEVRAMHPSLGYALLAYRLQRPIAFDPAIFCVSRLRVRQRPECAVL